MKQELKKLPFYDRLSMGEKDSLEFFFEAFIAEKVKEIEGMKREKIKPNFYANGGIRYNQGFNKGLQTAITILKDTKS